MPVKKIIDQIKLFASKVVTRAKQYLPVMKELLQKLFSLACKYWRSIAIMAPFLLFLYYAVGSMVSHKIDKNTDFTYPKVNPYGFEIIDASAALIKREVDDHMWTANLPFIFPAYILDNMPWYQQGIIHSLRLTVKPFLMRDAGSKDLEKAFGFLSYPPNVWLLSKTENLTLAPSSGAQYRKARKSLLEYNEQVRKDPEGDWALMTGIIHNFMEDSSKIAKSLEKQVRENSQDWFDLKADDQFYYTQGKLYGYYIVLKALSHDFSDQIVAADMYGKTTSLLKTLENALRLEPAVVRNGAVNALFASNHLMTLNFYVMKVHSQLNTLYTALQREN